MTYPVPVIIDQFHDDLKEICEKRAELHDVVTIAKLINIFNLTIFDPSTFKYKDINKKQTYNMMKTFIERRKRFFNFLIKGGIIMTFCFMCFMFTLAYDLFRHGNTYYYNGFPDRFTEFIHSYDMMTFRIAFTGIVLITPMILSILPVMYIHQNYIKMGKLLSKIMSKEKIE